MQISKKFIASLYVEAGLNLVLSQENNYKLRELPLFDSAITSNFEIVISILV